MDHYTLLNPLIGGILIGLASLLATVLSGKIFLDIFGAWDPALLFVMAGAVGVYGLGMVALRRFGSRSLKLPSASSSPIDRRLVIGAAIFGVGWGLGGFCPGPALANLGALRTEALVFVPAMTIGMVLAQNFSGPVRR